MLAYCDNGGKWDQAGEEAFEQWWRGEALVLSPAEQARVNAGEPIPNYRAGIVSVPR